MSNQPVETTKPPTGELTTEDSKTTFNTGLGPMIESKGATTKYNPLEFWSKKQEPTITDNDQR